MNVVGERIIVFGDSTSHHSSDNAPEIWDVDAGSNRASGQPGDLLASMLLERGAEAVRVNARVGRSAFNFFGREAFQPLLDSDAAFAPTKVFVVLGTNDIGLDPVKERDAFELIKGFYEKQGAEVWAIGPWTYTRADLNAGAVPVVELMQSVFGSRFIDGRPLSVQTGRAGDGVHFGAGSAAQTAQNAMQAIEAASAGLLGIKWGWIAAGVAAALGGMYLWKRTSGKGLSGLAGYRVVYLGEGARAVRDGAIASSLEAATAGLKAHKRRGLTAWIEDDQGNFVPVAGAKKKPTELGKLGEYCNPNSSPEAFKRCVARQKRSALGAPGGRMSKQEAIDEYKRLVMDPDPASMAVVEDLVMTHDLKLSQLSLYSAERKERAGSFRLTPGRSSEATTVIWKTDPSRYGSDNYPDRCNITIEPYVDGQLVTWFDEPATGARAERFSDALEGLDKVRGTPESCAREATKVAWGVAKNLKTGLALTADVKDKAHRERMRMDIARVAIENALVMPALKNDPEELFGLGSDYRHDPIEHPTVELRNKIRDAVDDTELEVVEDFAMQHNIRLRDINDIYLTPIGAADAPQSRVSTKIIRVEANKDENKQGWTIEHEILWNGKKVEALDGKPYVQVGSYDRMQAVAAAERWAIVKRLKGIPIGSLPSRVRREAAKAANSDETYDQPVIRRELYGLGAESDLALEDRRRFRRIMAEPGVEAMDVAEDFAEEKSLKLRDLTAANYSHGHTGTIAIWRPRIGDKNTSVYNVWWDIEETEGNKPGKYVATWDIMWDSTRVDLPTLLQPAYFDTLEEAQWAATSNAWSAARVLRRLDHHVTPETAKTALQIELESEFDRDFKKEHLFGLGTPDWKPITKALKAKHFKKAAKLWRQLHKAHGFVEAPAATKKALDALETHERAAYDILIAKGGLGTYEPTDVMVRRILATDDTDATMSVAADQILERGERLSQITKHGGAIGPHTEANYALQIAKDRHLRWHIGQVGMGRCNVRFVASSGRDTGSAAVEEGYYGSPDYCERVAAQDAWTLAKALRKIEPTGPNGGWRLNQSAELLEQMKKALNTVEAQTYPDELFGNR